MSVQNHTELMERTSELLDDIESSYRGVRIMEAIETKIQEALAVSDFKSLQGLVNNGFAFISTDILHAQDLV